MWKYTEWKDIEKDIDTILPDDDETRMLMPKPFVFEDMITPLSTKVYLPGQTYTPFADGLPITSIHLCMCVHVCKQFQAYPTTKWGIRVIPTNAKCPFGGRCHGAHLMWNGKPTGKSLDIPTQLTNGLTKPQKTK